MPIDAQLCARVRQWVGSIAPSTRRRVSAESYDHILLPVRDAEVVEHVTNAPGHWHAADVRGVGGQETEDIIDLTWRISETETPSHATRPPLRRSRMFCIGRFPFTHESTLCCVAAHLCWAGGIAVHKFFRNHPQR